MKATIVLIADAAAENYGRKIMLEANRAGGVGFEMARLPQHVSLKQPFFIKSLEEMEERFGPCPAEHDNDYVFHMTVSIGGAPYEDYKRVYEELAKRAYREELVFDKLGLLYYDDDFIRPGTYFCYKVAKLVEHS